MTRLPVGRTLVPESHNCERGGAKPQGTNQMTDDELLLELDLGAKPKPRADTVERPTEVSREARECFMSYERDLVPADLEALAVNPEPKAQSLVRIHASHHALARCLAAGMRPMQAALVTGYSPGRISVLQNDPAFKALVAEYRAEAASVFANMGERMSNCSMDALELLQERLHASPQEFTVSMLMDVIRSFADRTGHGPGSEVNLKISPSDLIDRPPRETREEWERRRLAELAPPTQPVN